MKQTGRILLVLLLCLGLFGCEKSPAREVEDWINAIGEVTADSGAAIEKVRDIYNALPETERQTVENAEVLFQAEAAYADAVIRAIGEPTADKTAKVLEAEQILSSLTAQSRALVTEEDTLTAARETLDRALFRKTVTGIWVNEVTGPENDPETNLGRGLIRREGLQETNCDPSAKIQLLSSSDEEVQADCRQFELGSDGILLQKSTIIGTWEPGTEENSLRLSYRTADGTEQTDTLHILEEAGFTKLVGSVFGGEAFGYVKKEEYRQAFETKYVLADVTRDNIYEYIGDPVPLGKLKTADGEEADAFVYPGKVYDRGLVYLGSSCTFRVDYKHGGMPKHYWENLPVMTCRPIKVKDMKINTAERISGELYYIRSEFVAKNEVNADGFRILELTNGVKIVFDGYDDTLDTFWNRVEASYSDYCY